MPAPEPPLYRFITWHSGRGGWVVQVREHGHQRTVGGAYRTQDEAASVLCKFLGVRSVQKLKRRRRDVQTSQPPEPRRFKHVTWHKSKQCWVAKQPQTNRDLGFGASQVAAARLVLQHLGARSLQVIRLTGQHEAEGRAHTSIKGTAQRVRAYLQALQHVYDLDKDVPGDLLSAIAMQKKHAAEFQREPALELLAIQGKYGPWKDSLLSAWRAARSINVSRPQRILDVLTSACHSISKQDYHVWVDNCGRHVTHHSGFLAMLLRLGVLAKPGSTASGPPASRRLMSRSPRTRGSLPLGVNGVVYDVVLEVRKTKLQHFIGLADAVAGVLNAKQPPETLQDYWKLWQECTGVRDEFQSGYLWPWTLRSMLLARARVLAGTNANIFERGQRGLESSGV